MAILSKLTDTLAIKTIEAYQQHLSPIKGFKCATGQLYGGTTCSGAVKKIIQKQGYTGAFLQSILRKKATQLILDTVEKA